MSNTAAASASSGLDDSELGVIIAVAVVIGLILMIAAYLDRKKNKEKQGYRGILNMTSRGG